VPPAISDLTYVLPIRRTAIEACDELAAYLGALAALVPVVVVDGSPPPVFAHHAACWPGSVGGPAVCRRGGSGDVGVSVPAATLNRLPPRSGTAFLLEAGAVLEISAPVGGQVADLVAFAGTTRASISRTGARSTTRRPRR
jgi:Domain of unknown function (DUF1989)